MDLDRTTAGEPTLDGHSLDGHSLDGPELDAGLQRGQPIGRYVALRRLGSGGMGVVWAAWDPELDREVALKLLTRRVAENSSRSQWLLREAQAMARLAHPNIVAVHDVGLFEGRVFVAMEYVRGLTLREWEDAERRAWTDVLAVYRQAARGLGAAHQAGLVHRDFKPDNAMVDAGGRVRVMDFGLAAIHDRAQSSQHRVLDLPITPSMPSMSTASITSTPSPITSTHELVLERSTSNLLSRPLTEVGGLVGTPGYMAPEQFDGTRGGPAADQFALCVALWHALYGERPFPGQTVHELMAAVTLGRLRKPSSETRVPESIHAALVRGLQTDPAARWPTMEALDAALELVDREPSRWWWLGLAGVAASVIGLGFWSEHQRTAGCADRSTQFEAWDPTRRETIARSLREAGSHGDGVWTRVEPAIDEWVASWTRISTHACLDDDGLPEQLRVAQAICLDRRERAFEATLSLLEQADGEIAARAVDMIAKLPSPDSCSDAEALSVLDRQPPPTDPEAAKRVRERIAEGEAAREAGRYREAKTMLAAERETTAALGDRLLHGELLAAIGWLEHELGEPEQAIATLTSAYAELLRAGADEAAAEVATDLILAHARIAKPELARSWDVHAQALIERVLAGTSTRSEAASSLRADRLIALAVTAEGAGEYREALVSFESAAALIEAELGPDSLRLARMLDELGAVQSRLGELDAAEASQLRALELVSAGLGLAHPEVGAAHFNLGNTAYRKGDLASARVHFEQAIAIVEPALGREHGVVTGSLTGLGAIALAEGDDEDAAANFRAAVVRVEARFGPEHPDLVPPLVNLGVALKRAGDYEAAEAAQLRALALREAQFGPNHPDLLAALDNLGELRVLAGDFDGAIEAYTRSLAIGEQAFGIGNPELDYALVGLGDAELARGNLEPSGAWYERVLADTKVEGKNHGLVAVAEFGLARVLEARGELGKAIERAERARERVLAQANPDAGDLAKIDAWLAEHD